MLSGSSSSLRRIGAQEALVRALRGINAQEMLPEDCVRPVVEVEGAFLVKGVLSDAELRPLLAAVRAVHAADTKND